jgi:hypothetical protein
VSWLGRRHGGQVTVPDGGHAGVELAGVVEKLFRALVVGCGACDLGVKDQPSGGDLIPVLLPQPGTRGVCGGLRWRPGR